MILPGVPEWIILTITACILLYLYATKERNYWKKQNIPYEKLSIIIEPAKRFLCQPLHEADAKRCKKYGKLLGIFEGVKPCLLIAEPDLIKLILVKDFQALPNRRPMTFFDPLLDNSMNVASGKQWKKIRSTVSPAFSAGKLRKMYALFEECAMVTTQHLEEAAERNKDVDMKQFFGHYALDLIARCAFGTKLDSHTDISNEFVTKSREAFAGMISLRLILSLLFPGIINILKIKTMNSEGIIYFKELLRNIINYRRQKSNRHEDFLQLMMDAQEGGISMEAQDMKQDTHTQLVRADSLVKGDSPGSVKVLTEDEAMAQCVLFFLAGQETNSSTLAYASYILALNPEIQAKLREEADTCFATHENRPPLEVVSKLPYLHAVVSETLRMFPSTARVERCPTEDYTLGDTGIKVPKGCVIAVPIFALHYDPENFPDPHKFDPERFSEKNVSSIRPYTYLPFGAGPRNCIGMQFALQAVKLCLLYAVHSVEFVRTEKTKVPLEFRKAFFMISAKDITIGIRKRAT